MNILSNPFLAASIPVGTVACALTAAILYTIGILMLKRATSWNPGPWRTTLICNWIAAIVFAPMLIWGESVVDGDLSRVFELLWQAFCVAAFFVIGQTCVILAVTHGDVSLATPILGLKILFVAAILFVFADQPVSIWIWPAAVLSVIAIGCLSYQPRRQYGAVSGDHSQPSRRIWITALTSLIAAVAYAIFDSMIQVWSPVHSPATFLPTVMFIAAGISLGMLPKLEGGFTKIPSAAWPWLMSGGFLAGLQSVFLTYAIGTWGNAASANVIYSSRGLWSVVAVATVGQFFSRLEYEAPRSVKTMRLIGAILITLAIALVL